MPLTERQQMALLLEMTAKEFQEQEDNKDKGKKSGESSSSKRSGTSSKRDSQKINKRNKRGETQLHLASIKGDVDGVKGLIKKGADVNITDYAGWTPLHEACNRGHYRIVKILLKSGANVNAKGLEDDTPLHDASSNGHIKIVKILLKYGADPNKKNENLENPFDVSASSEVDHILEEYCALTETERENYSCSEDSAPESTSDDEISSVRSSEADQSKFESHPEDRVDDDNNNDNDDEILSIHRKNKVVSSRVTNSRQKRISSDADDDDESDDDMELSRISEMVKRKKLAAVEKSEKAKHTALESHSTASESQSAKEDLYGDKVDTDQNLPSISTAIEESFKNPEVKSEDHTEVESADEISKKFKRKRITSEKSKEKVVPKSEDIYDDDDDKSVDENSKKFKRKRITSEKLKEKVVPKSEDKYDDDDDKYVDENSKKFRRKRITSEKSKEKVVPKSEAIYDDDDDDKSVDENSKKFRRKRLTSEKTKEIAFSRNDDIDDVDDDSVDGISKKFKRKRKTSTKKSEKTSPRSEDTATDVKSVKRIRKKLKRGDDLDHSAPTPKRAYRKKKAESIRYDDDDNGDDRLNDSKDNERNKSASKLQRRSSISDSSLSKLEKSELDEKNDNIFDDIVSPQYKSPPREFCTKSFDKNPYISDISDAEFEEGAVNANEDKITSDMFRANIFTNVLEKLSDQSPATDQHSLSEPQSDVGFSEPQSDVGFSDQATDSESLKNVEKGGMKRDENKQEWPKKSQKEEEMNTAKKYATPKEMDVDILLEAQSTSSADVVKLEDKQIKSEKKHKRRRISSRDSIEEKEIDSVKADKRKDYKKDIVAEQKKGKLREEEKAAKRSKKRRRSETEESGKKRRRSESSLKVDDKVFFEESGEKSMEDRFDFQGKNSSDKRVTSTKEIKQEMDDREAASANIESESEKKSVRSRLDTSEGSSSCKKKETTKTTKSPKEGKKYRFEQEVASDTKKKKASSTKSKIALWGMTSSSDTSDSEAILDVVRLPVEKQKKSKPDLDLKDETVKLSAEADRDSKQESDSHKVRKIRPDSSSKICKEGKDKESKKHRAKDSKSGKSDNEASLDKILPEKIPRSPHPKKSSGKDSEDSKGLELKFNEFKKIGEKEKYGNNEDKVRKIDTSSSKSEKHKKLSPMKEPRESKVSTKETKDSKALFKKSKEAKILVPDSKSLPKEKKISLKEIVESISSSKESRESKSPHKKSLESKSPTKEGEQTKSSSKEDKELKILTKEAKISSKEILEANSLSKESRESKSPFKKSHDSKFVPKESEQSKASYKESKEFKTLSKEAKISSKESTECNSSSKESKEYKSPSKKSHESKTSPKESEQSKSSSKESKDIKTLSKESKESKAALKQSKESKITSKDNKDSKNVPLKDSKMAPKESKTTPVKAKRESKDVDLKIWDFGLQLTPVQKVSKSSKSQMKSKESKKVKSTESKNKKERELKFVDQRLEPKSAEKDKPKALPTLDVCLPLAVVGVESSDSSPVSKKSERKSAKPVDEKSGVGFLEVVKEGDSVDSAKTSLSDASPPKLKSPLPSPGSRKQIHDEPTQIEDNLKRDENVTDFPADVVDNLETGGKLPVDVLGNQDEDPKRALKVAKLHETEMKPITEDVKPCIEDLKNANKDQDISLEGAEKEKGIEEVVVEDNKTSVQPLVKDVKPLPASSSELPEQHRPSEEVSGAALNDMGSVTGDLVIKRRSLSDIECLAETSGSIDNARSIASDKVVEHRSLSDVEGLAEARGSLVDMKPIAGDQVTNRRSPPDIEGLAETGGATDDTRSAIDDQLVKRRSLSDTEDLAETRGSIDDLRSITGDQVIKRRSDIEDLAETRGSTDDTESVAGDKIIKHHSLSDIKGLAETRELIDDTGSAAGDQVIKRRSLSDIKGLVETRELIDDTGSAAGDQVIKRRSLSDIKGLAETRELIDDTGSAAGDQVIKRRSVSDIVDLPETGRPTEDTGSFAGDQVVKRRSLSDIDGLVETKGRTDDTGSAAGDQAIKRRSISDIESLAETAFEASDAVSMDSPRSPHKKSDTSSTHLETLTSWPKGEENKIATSTDAEVKEQDICDNEKTKVPLREVPLHEKEVKDNEQESRTVAVVDEDEHTAINNTEDKGRPEVDDCEVDEPKAVENTVGEPHEDGISDLGAVSDLEEHLGPFHGTKLEETDIDMKELSHPEETLKILTQGIRNAHASREEHKDTEHDFSSIKMTGHDFSMLSEEINDKIQRLCSRSFVSELSEEDRHIVNISMEIAENLSQERDENVDNTLDDIEEIENDIIGNSSQETLDSIDGFNKDSNEISGSSSPVIQQGKVTGSPADKNNDMGLSTANLSTNIDHENKGMDSDKLIVVSGSADTKTSITGSRLDFNEVSSTATTVSEHEISRTVGTESPVTSQVTDAVCKPTYTRSRTVDLEPRGIAQVVADIDLNSISHCIMDNTGPAREAPATADNTTDPEAAKEKIDDENMIRRPDETEAAHDVNRDSFKKSISPTFPSTWRKALLKDHMKASQTLPEAYEKFAVVKGNYLLADSQSESERPADDDSQLEELNQEHLIELERLHLCMEQELVRVERRYRLACSKKKSISACSAIMYQKLEQYAKLSRYNHSMSQPSMSETEAGELRKTWIKEVLDKFKRKEEEMLKRHCQELSCLEQRQSFNKMHSLGREGILRKRYLAAQRLSSMLLT